MPELTSQGVELQQLVGRRQTKNGVQQVRQPVDRIFRDGVCVGSVGRHTGAPICFLPSVNQAEHDDIAREVARIRDEEGRFGPPGKTHAAPPLPAEAYAESDDELEDANE